jgi:hypothetical protein
VVLGEDTHLHNTVLEDRWVQRLFLLASPARSVCCCFPSYKAKQAGMLLAVWVAQLSSVALLPSGVLASPGLFVIIINPCKPGLFV